MSLSRCFEAVWILSVNAGLFVQSKSFHWLNKGWSNPSQFICMTMASYPLLPDLHRLINKDDEGR